MSTVTALMRETPVKLLDALTTTADTKGSSFAIPPSFNQLGRVITWQSIPVVTPDAISLQLQGAMNDTDSEYAILDTSTVAVGEMRTVTVINVRFVRA